MDNYKQHQSVFETAIPNQDRTIAKTFMANVFLWMFAALAISAGFAYYFAQNAYLLEEYFFTAEGKMSLLGYLIMFAPLGFVMLMSFGYQKLSMPMMALCFVLYSSITGISLSFILLLYTATSVVSCFASAAAMFGVMAVMGYTTKKDLTSFGRIMIMGLIGIVIASLVNIFLQSDAMGYIISLIGIAVFTGLTAYDVQKLKNIGAGFEMNGTAIADTRKASIYGALTLYLDFINLFLMLLRVFGRRN